MWERSHSFLCVLFCGAFAFHSQVADVLRSCPNRSKMSAKAVADEKWNTEVQEIATVGLGKAGFLGLWGSKPRAT